MRTLFVYHSVVLAFFSTWIPFYPWTQICQAAEPCPDMSQGETSEDCPWAEVARKLQNRSPEAMRSLLESQAPELLAQLKKDSQHAVLQTIWGKSRNFDELAKGVIVAPAILKFLSQELGISAPEEASTPGGIAHAGMEHTYGYLLSTLKTPFGFKRARWVKEDIELGLGIPRGHLGPKPPQGTLLSNATYFAGRIAFEFDTRERASLAELEEHIAPAISHYSYDSLRIKHLVETVHLEHLTLKIRTDFVEFKNPVANSENTHLLVYSLWNSKDQRAQLITLFPVQKSFVDRALAPQHLGEDQEIQLRYNATSHHLNRKLLRGTRTAW